MPTPCGTRISDESGSTPQEGDQLLRRMGTLAQQRAARTGQPITQALRDIAGELQAEQDMSSKVMERNTLLSIQAKRNVKDFVDRFKTMGEGVRSFLTGSSKVVQGSRLSIDAQIRAIHGKYFGALFAELEKQGVFHDFRKGEMVEDIYKEMGAIKREGGSEPATDNQSAYKIAHIIDDVTREQVARQNRAGAYIQELPGYIIRQTHDQQAIRALGGKANNAGSKQRSFDMWRDFTLPLLDPEKTFKGADAGLVMRNIHEALYSGIHGPARDEANLSNISIQGSLADKVSEARVIHFKDAESAYKYNQAFGIRDFKEAVLNDIHSRSRSIGLMENLGPTPERTLDEVMVELRHTAREQEDSAKQLDSLNSWRIQGMMNEVTGRNEVPENFTLNRLMTTTKTWLQLSKMGAVTLSSFADKAFLQTEMAYQGMSNMHVLAKQVTGMFPRGPEQKRALRLMGVAMDGLLGNAMSRYSSQSTMSGWAHTAQKYFFDLNLLNSWTDANKATAAELMSAHLGEHANLPYDELPPELGRVLSLYDISRHDWDVLRSTANSPKDSVGTFIVPDGLSQLPDQAFMDLLAKKDIKPTTANIIRERNRLDTSLRTFFSDRIDIAVPTPGANERMWATMDTKAGTPLGEAVRLLTMFKSFPLTIMNKVLGRTIYGQGSETVGHWIMNDHRGKFNLATLLAMGTIAGYVSGAIRDALKGREPKPVVNDDGTVNWSVLNDAAIRGGTLGIMGDVLLSDYDKNFKTFLGTLGGPVVGQFDQVANLATQLKHGSNIMGPAGKLLLDNTPMINLFYTRPILDYFVLWNLEEMMTPGSLAKRESAVERQNHQGFFIRPSETVNH